MHTVIRLLVLPCIWGLGPLACSDEPAGLNSNDSATSSSVAVPSSRETASGGPGPAGTPAAPTESAGAGASSDATTSGPNDERDPEGNTDPDPGNAEPPNPNAGAGGVTPLGQGGATAGQGQAAGGNGGGSSGAEPDGGAGGTEPAAGDADAGTSAQDQATDDPIELDPELLQTCSGENPIRCELQVDDGNHAVTARVGPGTTRIQSELYRISALPSGSMEQEFTFSVNVRPEQHDGYSAPGGILNLLFEGDAPELIGLGVAPAPDTTTVFVAGDSTVCDWDPALPSIIREDERGWAQALTQYFTSRVAVANFADSGETAGGFYGKFFGPARDAMREGDYLFIQFGHNDQKDQGAVNDYQANLMRYVNDARERGATPVLFTPVGRKSATLGNPGFAGLDEQVRQLAATEDIALVDLTVLSIEYYASVANKDDLFVDGTHFSENGASGVAGIVARTIAESELPLAELVR